MMDWMVYVGIRVNTEKTGCWNPTAVISGVDKIAAPLDLEENLFEVGKNHHDWDQNSISSAWT